MRTGRTIAEKREALEKAAERESYHKKLKREKRTRVFFSCLGLAVFAAVFIFVATLIFGERESSPFSSTASVLTVPYAPTIEVVDEDTGAGADHLTSRMKEYIGQAEVDFRELGYYPKRAVIPSGAIREVDFYLDNYPGYIKMIIDRPTGVSVEDADRMLRYLASIEVTEFSYIDVRLDGKAYWK